MGSVPIVVAFNKLRLAEDKGTFRHQHVETRERPWRRRERRLFVCSPFGYVLKWRFVMSKNRC